MGARALASRRRRWSAVLATVIAPAAVFVGVAGSSCQSATDPDAAPAADVDTGPLYQPQVITASPDPFTRFAAQPAVGPVAPMPASRWRAVGKDALVHQALPAGIAPERGLQVKTILVARNISVVFPEIGEIGGVRADALRWHPDGLALDVMIPNPSSAEGIALGNQVAAYALQNAERFGLQDVIWRGVYYTPAGPQSSGYGHFDHVHITTTGGGYPTGGEVYYR